MFKFGGASVKDAKAVGNAASILKGYVGQPVLIVISAMGKNTNALEELANDYFNSGNRVIFIPAFSK